MEDQVQVEPFDYTARWVSYFDSLGFTELVNTHGWYGVYHIYNKAIEGLTKDYGCKSNIERMWFSDTFLLYSPDCTANSFTEIEQKSRQFIDRLILDSIPVRGAMSYGDFYADKGKNYFFGPALIEAYHYGENQDWIGFVLTPSAVRQMAAIGLDANKGNYAYWDIPYKKEAYHANASKAAPILQKSLPAYIIGRHGVTNGRNIQLDRLYKMKGGLKDNRLIRKYENTINFIEAKNGH
jgi:hypothetical protein